MKVIGILLVLCLLAGAMSQTMAPTQLDCYMTNRDEIRHQLGDDCFNLTNTVIPTVSHTA